VKVKKVLDLAGLNYEENILDTDYTRDEFYEKFGPLATFPRVTLNEELIGGCTETIKYLREKDLV
jgi:glutaredoxin